MQEKERRQQQSQAASEAAAATRTVERMTGSQKSKGARGQGQQASGRTTNQQHSWGEGKGTAAGRKQ